MNLSRINCIFCGKESKRIEWVENGFTGKRCDCGLLYVSPRPDLSDILNLYVSDEAIVSLKPSYNAEFASRLTSRHRLKLLRQFISQGSLVEIGCADGYFLDESRRAGFEPYGIELNLRQAKFMKEELEIPVETNPFTESSFGGIYFDVICHFDVISHFYDPLSEFKKFNKSLKNSGILLFETGNGGDLSKWWLNFIGHLQYPQHLFLFSKKNIEQLCRQTGFEIIRTYRYSIFFQIGAIKLIQWLRKKLKEIFLKKEKITALQGMPEVSRTYPWWRGLFFKGLILMSFFVRYKIGRIILKIGPQTIIYIAKKASTIDSK
jgi:SAM-dependent methyltransferase